MLTERNLELLTAFVDGELTLRQRKTVYRLLNQSSEARLVLRDIQEASHRLRELPHRKLGDDFAVQVMQTMAERGLQPSKPSRADGSWSRSRVFAAAASVMLAVGLGVYFLTSRPSHSTIATGTLPQPTSTLRLTFKELAEKPKQELLAKQLKKESAVHLDVTVRNNARAVEHLQDALKSQGIQMIVPKDTHARLKKEGQGNVEYFVYAENVRTEELATILQGLPGAFEAMVLTSLSSEHRQNLSGLLGIPASELEALEGKLDAQLFENTIIEAPKNQIKKPNPITPPRAERFAMILANDSGKAGTISAEVTRFLASRRQQQPGTVQVLFVIRQA